MKSNIFKILCLYVCCMTACSKSTGKEAYTQLLNSKGQHVTSFKEAISYASSPEIIKFGTKTIIELNFEDSILKNNEIISYYKIFKFSGIENQKISVSIKSLCGCGGYNKQIVYPLLYILDSTGHPINLSKINYEKKEPVFAKYPWHLYGVKSVNLPNTGDFFLFVAANNKSMEQVEGTARMVSAEIVLGPNYHTKHPFFDALNIRRHPTGKLELEIN